MRFFIFGAEKNINKKINIYIFVYICLYFFFDTKSDGVATNYRAVLLLLGNDEKRKQTEFVNNEKRKKELHQLKKKRSRDVSNKRLDPKPMPPMVMRMKKLLSDALSAANSFTIKCLTPRCVCKISPLS